MTIVKFYEETRDTEGKLLAVTPNTNLPTPSEVRNRWCFGLPLNKEDGEVMSDEDILQFLKGAIQTVERKLGIFLKPTKIVTNADERGLIEGVDFDKDESAYDYDAKAYRQYGFMQLKERPVQSIEGLRMVLPNGMTIIDFTRDENTRKWIKLYKDSGQVHIVPYAGDPTLFAMMGGSQSAYPFATGRINSNLPQMFYVDYTAGYKLYQVPEDIRNVVAKMASIDILGIAGDAILAGVASQSTSIDGLSESVSTTASATSATYNAHILQYQKEIDALFSPKGGAVRSSERGITFVGL
jgi:hypothetical protein